MKIKILIIILLVTFESLVHAQGFFNFRERFFRKANPEESHLTFGEAKTAVLKKGKLDILVWNIKKAEMEEWPNEFLIYSANKELILIQEAFKNSIFNQTINLLKGIRWDMGVSFFDIYHGKIPSGTLIGSVANPNLSLVKHSTYFEPIIKTPKSLTITKYAIEGSAKLLLVISVHAINLTSIFPFKRYIDIAHNEISKHDGPVIYAGDFNTWSEDRTKYLFSSVEKLNLTPIDFKNGHLRMKFRKNFLDHAFVRGVNVKSAEVAWESQGSDHKPLLIEAEIL